MITITLKLFATLNQFMPDKLEHELPGIPHQIQIPDESSLADLIVLLKIPAEEVKLCYVNGIYQEVDYILKENDAVGIFPPVGGG